MHAPFFPRATFSASFSGLFFVASLSFCHVALQLVPGRFPFSSASVPVPLISQQLLCTFNLQFLSWPHQIHIFSYQFPCHCPTSCNFLLSPLFLSLSLLFPQSSLPCTSFSNCLCLHSPVWHSLWVMLDSFPRFMCCFLCCTSGRESSEYSHFSHLCSVETLVWPSLELVLQNIPPSSSAWCKLTATGLSVGAELQYRSWVIQECVNFVIFGWFLAAHCSFLKGKKQLKCFMYVRCAAAF